MMNDAALSLFVIRTSNLNACLDFYQRLGLVFVEEKHGAGPIHYSCSSNCIVFELYPRASHSTSHDKQSGESRLGFNVASLKDVLSRLEEVQIQIIKPPSNTKWGRRAIVLDPDGRTVELNEAGLPSPKEVRKP
jgi:lactoylglutathione lyase